MYKENEINIIYLKVFPLLVCSVLPGTSSKSRYELSELLELSILETAFKRTMFASKSLKFSLSLIGSKSLGKKAGAFLCDSTTRMSRSMEFLFEILPISFAVAVILNL